VLAVAFVASPLYLRQAIAAFEAVDPDLVAAARSLGAGRARTFFRVVLPLARQGLAGGEATFVGLEPGRYRLVVSLPGRTALEQAVELLAQRAAKTGKGAPARSTKGKAAKGKTVKGKGAKGKGAKAKGAKRARGAAPKRPKATNEDLRPFLDELDPQVADVVRRVEGMNGSEPQPHDDVARALNLEPGDVERLHKRGMFKLRMAFGKSRNQEDRAGGSA